MLHMNTIYVMHDTVVVYGKYIVQTWTQFRRIVLYVTRPRVKSSWSSPIFLFSFLVNFKTYIRVPKGKVSVLSWITISIVKVQLHVLVLKKKMVCFCIEYSPVHVSDLLITWLCTGKVALLHTCYRYAHIRIHLINNSSTCVTDFL